MIPFNKPGLVGTESGYLEKAILSGKLAGDGYYTKACHQFFQDKYGFRKVFLTTSCTDALEMSALLIDIKEGDEVIIPSYTFVSTANAFALRGAKIVFADSNSENPNIDASTLEALINAKTKAIVLVHYAGIACNIGEISALVKKYNLYLIEDAAQAIDSFYEGKPLGSFGHLAAFSFHETKNIVSGEGGMLVINDEAFVKKAEIIREKGTNRSAFFRGEVDKYNWVAVGSSFLPSELIAAFLFAQLEAMEEIQQKRVAIWNKYYQGLKFLQDKGLIKLPSIPDYASNNGHMFYLVFDSLNHRSDFIKFLKDRDIQSVFHYLTLHNSPYFNTKHDGRILPNAEMYQDCLVRLPFYNELSDAEIGTVINSVIDFFDRNN